MPRAAHFRIHVDLRRTASAVCRRRLPSPADLSSFRSSQPWPSTVPLSPQPEFLTQLAEQRPLWEPLITFDPWSRHYVRLAAASGVEAWLLTWLPGQGTEWHDHGGSAGAFLTVLGALTEQQAMVQPRRAAAGPAGSPDDPERHAAPVRHQAHPPGHQ